MLKQYKSHTNWRPQEISKKLLNETCWVGVRVMHRALVNLMMTGPDLIHPSIAEGGDRAASLCYREW